MNSKTHMYVGAAASLAILQPVGVGNSLIGIAGGLLGGWLCDIDLNTKSDLGDYFAGAELLAVLGIIGALDFFFGFGIIDYILVHRSIISAVGAALFVLLGVLGAKWPALNPHRTFMHSLLAVALFSVALALAFPPIVLPFAIGMLLHILLDLTNKSGVQILFPLGFKPCLQWCDSDGTADKVIRFIALAATIFLAVWRISGGIVGSSDLATIVVQAQQRASLLGLSMFQIYVIAINIFTFLFACYDYQRYNRNMRDDKGESPFDTINTYFCNLLTFAGGALGMLIALIVCNLDTKRSWDGYANVDMVRQGEDGNAYWYVLVVSALIAWVGIYLAVVNPLGLDYRELASFSPLGHIPLIAGFIALNLLTFYAFWRDRDHKRRRFDGVQFMLLLLCAIGGSVGGLVAMAVTGKKMGSGHFINGVPLLLVANAITIVILILTGIA